MKKGILKVLITVLIISVLACSFAVGAFAATKGTASVSTSGSTNVGGTVTATFTFSHAQKIAYIKATLSYDTDELEFIEAEGAMTNGSSGAILFNVNSMANASKTVTVKFKFKAKKVGSAYIGVKDNAYDLCYDSDENEITFSGAGLNVSITDQSATKSSNAKLRSISSPYPLVPSFSPTVYEYSVTVPNNVSEYLISFKTQDDKANAEVDDTKVMKVGVNTRTITVTAEDGTTKKYILKVTRLEADGTTPDPDLPDPENPLDGRVTVTADGQDKYIATEFPIDDPFHGYSLDIFTYGDKEFPAMTRDDTTLVYLTDIDGENGAFYIVTEDNKFELFKFITTSNNFYEFLKADEIPEGYSEIELNIGGFKLAAYQSIDPTLKDFALVYAKGPDGNIGFYTFDTVEQTMQRFDGVFGAVVPTETPEKEIKGDNFIEKFMSLDTSTKVVCIVIVAIILLILIAIIILIVKIARPADYDEETDYNDEIEEEIKNDEELGEFEFVSISDRDETEE